MCSYMQYYQMHSHCCKHVWTHIYIYQQKAFYICYVFTHTTLTVRIDAKLKKDCVSCFQTYHWVRDKGQGMDIFEESPLDSMTFLLQVI